MLLSDADITAAIEAGRIGLEPYDRAMVQPSSVDVRLDRYFRVFENHKYPHIDPSQEQDQLTRMVSPKGDEPFILHPGEFVLASSYEEVSLPDDLSARLEGKALDVETPVPTPDGWTAMGDLTAGDQVFDEQGRCCSVVAATAPMLDRPCYRVRFSDGTSLIADARHQWLTVTKADRSHRRRTCGSVRTTLEIADSLRVGSEWNHQVPLCEPVDYPQQGLPIDPYVLGVWLGAGAATKPEITVDNGDEELLDYICHADYEVWPSTGTRAFRIDGSLGSTLRQQGQFERKHVPETYLRASVDQRLALLQGLMDSGGYVDPIGRCEFVDTNDTLAEGVRELAASLGLRPATSKKPATLRGVEHGPAYQVKFAARIPVFRLERKRTRLRVDSGGHRFRAIVAAQEIPSVPVRCIQVSSPSGLFLAGPSFIPTHNSSLGRLGLLTHSTAGFVDAGFRGHVTLELSNVATLPMKLWPGMKIGQLCFFQLTSAAAHPYGSAARDSRYQGQRGPTPSRSHLNFHRTEV